MCEQWQLHCTSQWGWKTPFREHVYCVATAFGMTEQVEQWICIKFWVQIEHSLNIPPRKLFGWVDDSEGRSYGKLVIGSFIMTMHPFIHHVSRAEFFGKHQITQVTQLPYSPDLVSCDFWFFPKLKSALKGKGFQTLDEIQENTTGQLTAIGSPKVFTLKGTEALLSYVQCSLYLLQ